MRKFRQPASLLFQSLTACRSFLTSPSPSIHHLAYRWQLRSYFLLNRSYLPPTPFLQPDLLSSQRFPESFFSPCFFSLLSKYVVKMKFKGLLAYEHLFKSQLSAYLTWVLKSRIATITDIEGSLRYFYTFHRVSASFGMIH